MVSLHCNRTLAKTHQNSGSLWNKSYLGYLINGTIHTAGGNVIWKGSVTKSVSSFLTKLKLELPSDPVVPLLGTEQKES